MKVLIVTSGNKKTISPFVKEQAQSLGLVGIEIDYFLIRGKGTFGYLKNYFSLVEKLTKIEYDLVHAHYGLSGLLATLQRITPVIVTFHGSDVNFKKNYFYSLVASKLSSANVFVHRKLANDLKYFSSKNSIIPCGVDTKTFHPILKAKARKKLNWKPNINYVLFSSSFENKIKNVSLAKSALKKIQNTVLIELKNFKKNEINLMLNACDMLLVTSLSETGPIIVKEALSCNCPVVSTNVGDVKEIIKNVDNCYLTDYNSDNLSEIIQKVIKLNIRSNGRNFVKKYGLNTIAKKIFKIYREVKIK